MRKLILSMLLVAMLAGCTSADPAPESPEAADEPVNEVPADDNEPAPTGGETPTAPEGNETPAPTENETIVAPDTPPTANLTADVTSGEGLLSVTFTFNGTDADGDALAWALDVDSDGTPEANGTELPGTFTFEYGEGDFTATFTVTANNVTADATVDISVSPAPPPCDTYTTTGANLVVPEGMAVGVSGAGYIIVGTTSASGIYVDDNGIPGLQTEESCPSNPDTRYGP